nr:hypothetical protein [Tanacetum cinerariifolium]
MPPKKTTTPMTDEAIRALIAQGIADALAEHEENRSRNGDDNHDSESDRRRRVHVARECTYTDFLKCQPINFKGIEGVVGTPLKVLCLLLLGTSSCSEETNKSKKTLHKLRASLTIRLANRVILPLQMLLLSLREKLQSSLKCILTTHNIKDLFHVRDPIFCVHGICRLLKGMGLLLVKAFKPSINSNRWGISISIQWSRTGTKLLANLYANLGKQCLQGTYGMEIVYYIMKEGVSILRGRKSVPGINSRERGNGKKRTTLSSPGNGENGKKGFSVLTSIWELTFLVQVSHAHYAALPEVNRHDVLGYIDYVLGLEEPEQAPPSPVYIPYVPEPEYPEYIPQEDKVFPAEEQPLPAAASPTTDSPGYIPESDPDEDPEEDPADYPADHDDDEEEEHPALADSIPPPPTLRVTARISFRPQPPTLSFTKEDAERFLAMPIPPSLPVTPLSSPIPQIPSSPLPASPPILPIPLPAASLPLQLLSSDHRADRTEVTLPPRKRLSIVHYPGYEAGESLVAAAARPIEGRRANYGFVDFVKAEIRRRRAEDIGYGIKDTWIDPRDVAEEDQRIDAQDTLIATLTTQLSSLQGHLATALGEIRVLQAREQARAGASEGAGSST